VDNNGAQVGMGTSIAVDSDDNPHISYFDETNDKIKYARWNGTSWQNETIDSLVSAGGYISDTHFGMEMHG
jgi:hypothetical protein